MRDQDVRRRPVAPVEPPAFLTGPMRWIGVASATAAGLVACSGEGSVLEKRAVLERQTWWDNRDWSWYEAHIPFFESPDTAIDATYYYRWELVTKHLTYGSPETGYTFTEFIDRPFWSGAYGAISCPLGHQLYEIRWLKDRRIIEDFARYWFETPGAQPRSYSNWYGDAIWATYLVLDDTAFLRAVFPHMKAQYAGWLAERGVALTGCDTWSYGPVPAEDPQRPFEVPQLLNVEHGVFVVENLDLSALAADGVREFCLVLTLPKLRGATGAWVSPIALI